MMRKFFVCLTIVLFTGVLAGAQNSNQGILQNATDITQTLMPLEVYVGDVAEVRFAFRSAVDFVPDLVVEAEINVNNFPFDASNDDFTVKTARFVRNDKDYYIILQVVPWRPGVIEFPVFDLFSVLDFDEEERNPNISYTIILNPIEIKSIVEKTGKNEIQPPAPPLIIPGTSYVIFGIVVLAIILFALVFRVIIKFGDYKRWIAHIKIRYAYRRNSVIALKKIKRLLRNTAISDIEFCASLQNITRAYLSFRFDYPFASVSAIGVRDAFTKICVGEIPSAIAYSVEDLISMFIRTDYIRYAHDSIDSELEPRSEHQAKLAQNERKSLSEMVVKAIKLFESDGQSEEENGVF